MFQFTLFCRFAFFMLFTSKSETNCIIFSSYFYCG
uniref:Uncharacterized protein n=1 Tax=Arundo donax TaxID=35708 RepID=A0A0A8YW78_ARUDO